MTPREVPARPPTSGKKSIADPEGQVQRDDAEFVTVDADWVALNEKQVAALDALAERLRAEGRALDALEVWAARGSAEVLAALMVEVNGHRCDTQRLINVGHTKAPRLADRMLYECAGLTPLTWDEEAHTAWIDAVKACGAKGEHKGCDGCSCSCHAYTQEQMAEDIAMVLIVYDEHVQPENRGPWRRRLAEAIDYDQPTSGSREGPGHGVARATNSGTGGPT